MCETLAKESDVDRVGRDLSGNKDRGANKVENWDSSMHPLPDFHFVCSLKVCACNDPFSIFKFVV